MLIIFLKSLIIGIAIAAPVGPIGLLCIKIALESGFKAALAVGLGAALADAVYGVIAGCGISAISSLLLKHAGYIQVVGGLLLLYLGYKEISNKQTSNKEITVTNYSLISLTFTTFILTLTNPLTIISFIGVFSSVSGDDITMAQALWVIMGVFLGSLLWWYVLVTIVSKSKAYLSNVAMQRIKYVSSLILIGFGLFSLIKAFN